MTSLMGPQRRRQVDPCSARSRRSTACLRTGAPRCVGGRPVRRRPRANGCGRSGSCPSSPSCSSMPTPSPASAWRPTRTSACRSGTTAALLQRISVTSTGPAPARPLRGPAARARAPRSSSPAPPRCSSSTSPRGARLRRQAPPRRGALTRPAARVRSCSSHPRRRARRRGGRPRRHPRRRRGGHGRTGAGGPVGLAGLRAPGDQGAPPPDLAHRRRGDRASAYGADSSGARPESRNTRRVIPLRWPSSRCRRPRSSASSPSLALLRAAEVADEPRQRRALVLRRAPRPARGRLPRRDDLGRLDAKTIAVLGVAAAAGRCDAAAQCGHGRARADVLPRHRRRSCPGPGVGFVSGALAVTAGALLTGGVGPWLPFQMISAGAAWDSAQACSPSGTAAAPSGGRRGLPRSSAGSSSGSS